MNHPVLTFLLDYLSSLNIQYIFTDGHDFDLASADLGLRNSILKHLDILSANPIRTLSSHTIYHITDYYGCGYSFFQLSSEKKLLFIGPYLINEISYNDIHTIMNQLQIPAELFPQLQEYYNALPVVASINSFSLLLQHSYSNIFSVERPDIAHLDLKKLESQEEFLKTHRFFIPEDDTLSMQLLEKRYRGEDDILDAIAAGNASKALTAAEALTNFRFTPRTDDELRNYKNLILTFNSLMRRTAYVAGVHPFYIDAVSTNYATLIEKCTTLDDFSEITPYMIRSYCDLVEKRSMTSYSEPVRQILVTIDASLTGDLSLKRFANDLFLNTSYLSTLFKKEVGITLTDYVNKNRIACAKRLLKSTTIPIQDVALKSGIPDIHYFTRLFRRETGMSPRQWRNQQKGDVV